MSMIWLEIDADPTVAIYREPAARTLAAGDIRYPRLVSVGVLREQMSIPGLRTGENGNVSLVFDNADGLITTLFRATPPIRATARIMSETGPLFTGLITRIDLSADARIDLEAGLFRPLTDALPLRNTTVWGAYDDVRTLPIPYGRAVTLPAIPHGDGRRYLIADCAIGGVDSVRVNGQAATGWTWRNGTDHTGHPVAWLDFTAPPGENAAITATLRGKLAPDDGSLITTPEGVLYDILRHLLGMAIDRATLDDFRAETAGIELAGALMDADKTIRATLDDILGSIGAAWSATAPGIAALWPLSTDDHQPVTAYTALTARDTQATTTHDAIANVIRIHYATDFSTGSTTRTAQAEDAESIATYGRIEREWQAPWTPSERQATTLATRLLAALSLPRWSTTWATDASRKLLDQVAITTGTFTHPPSRADSIESDHQRGVCVIGIY